MGARGPMKEPTALKILKGNPGHKALPPDEPKVPVGMVAPPKHLGAIARREYRRAGLALVRYGVLTLVDHVALAMYADAYQRWVESSELLNETGQLIRGRDGLPVASPAVKVQADAWARVVRSLDALGMTPAARPKVVAQAKVEPTDWWKEVVGVD